MAAPINRLEQDRIRNPAATGDKPRGQGLNGDKRNNLRDAANNKQGTQVAQAIMLGTPPVTIFTRPPVIGPRPLPRPGGRPNGPRPKQGPGRKAVDMGRFSTKEAARKAALEKFEGGKPLGPYQRPVIGRFGKLKGKRVGTQSARGKPFRRIREDYDPKRGHHYNVEIGRGAGARNYHYYWGPKPTPKPAPKAPSFIYGPNTA